MVALLRSSGASQFCGGTLVASKYVISAAHCMFLDREETQPLNATDFKVLKNLKNIPGTRFRGG